MNGVLHALAQIPVPLIYTVIASLVFAEAAVFVGFVLPGETACLAGGVLAAAGRLELAVLLPLVVVAAIAGDSVGYEVGRTLGTRVLASRPLRTHGDRLAGAQELLRRRGGTAVFLGRATAFLRAAIPALAGVSRMPYPRFLAFNAAGALVWGTGVTLLGYFAGNGYARAERTLGRASAALTLILSASAVLVWHHHHRRHRQ